MTSIVESFDSRDGAWMGVGFAAGLIIGVAASFTAVRVSDNRNRARRIEEAKERMYAAKREKALAEIEEQEAEVEEIEEIEEIEEVAEWVHDYTPSEVPTPAEEDGTIMGDLGAVPIFPDDIDKKFGFGNNDENVVYIRNEHYMCDYEITRRPGMSINEYGDELEGLG